MNTKYFLKLVCLLGCFFSILQLTVNTTLCYCQEYQIKESLQLLWNEEVNEWRNAYKIVHSYDAEGRRIEINNYKWLNTWRELKKVSHVYDYDGKLLESQVTDFDSNQTWFLVNKYNDRRYLVEIHKIYDNDTTIALLNYDSFGNLIEFRHIGTPSSTPYSCLYAYISNGKYIQVTATHSFDIGKHEQKWLYVQGDGHNILQRKIRLPGYHPYHPISFSSGIKYQIWYNNCHLDEIFPPRYPGHQHIHFLEPHAYSHNPIHDGKILSYFSLFEHHEMYSNHFGNFERHSWNYDKYTFEYDSKGKLVYDRVEEKYSRIISGEAFPGIWRPDEQNFYYYNDADNCTTIVSQNWDTNNGKWTDFAKYFYTYEEVTNSNLSTFEPKIETPKESFQLNLTNSPNPFNQNTTINFELEKPAIVTLQIYDIRGKMVRTLLYKKEYHKGIHRSVWDGTNNSINSVASGIYFIRIQINQEQQIKRCILIQ
jgi:hypothetical protein